MAEHIVIRQERVEDILGTFAVNHLAFGRNEEAKLVDALRDNPNEFIPELSIIVLKDTEIVGHILFTKILIKYSGGQIE
ncbi:MAG: GNAT family N-acetyltransferase [Sphingobacterium sp.]